ncbi:MAG: hypothetical protein JSU90_03610, partial [Nitrospiraceae bacterium]
MMGDAFTHSNYADIIATVKECGRSAVGVAAFFGEGKRNESVILRHDVDRWPEQAVRMARLEHKLGIASTYYFRCTRTGRFPERAMRAIADSGHETGYHYETLSTAAGNQVRALDLFKQNLERFRRIAPCITVSMHGSPLSRLNNEEMLTGIDLGKLGLIADASLSFADTDVVYYTDAGGSWNAAPSLNVRDRISPSSHAAASENPFGSDAFIRLLRDRVTPVYLSTHPERWACNTVN